VTEEEEMTRDVVILDGVRTAIGTFGGSLAGMPPTALATAVAKEAMARSGVEPGQIGASIFGHVINTEARDMYMGRVAAVDAGVPEDAPGLTVNRLCGSGAQAIVSAAQHIMLGDVDYALAGGAESMSRSPHSTQSIRTGQKMGDVSFADMMIGALSDPFGVGHMGVTAENVAAEHQVTREQQDAFAVESQRRATLAIGEGRFKSQILPIEVRVKRDMVPFATDEHVKSATTMESLAKLRPAFQKDGTVTAGNASGINDGAAALVLASADAAEAAGLKPRARLLGYAIAGVRHEVMGIGPIPAVKRLLQKIGMTADQFDVIESNEAFAAQACAVNAGLGLNTDKVNPNGGAIALGHPIGATGAIISIKALHELERINGRYGLVTMCIGGGQGIALAFERLN
jgi:acetyl-CoA C-acetyltransferase